MRNIELLKIQLKEFASQIKNGRLDLKSRSSAFDLKMKDGHYDAKEAIALCSLQSKLNGFGSLKYKYRHHHIAYCELRGKTRSQIENPKKENPAMEFYITEIKNKYAWTPEEIEAYNKRMEKRTNKGE